MSNRRTRVLVLGAGMLVVVVCGVQAAVVFHDDFDTNYGLNVANPKWDGWVTNIPSGQFSWHFGAGYPPKGWLTLSTVGPINTIASTAQAANDNGSTPGVNCNAGKVSVGWQLINPSNGYYPRWFMNLTNDGHAPTYNGVSQGITVWNDQNQSAPLNVTKTGAVSLASIPWTTYQPYAPYATYRLDVDGTNFTLFIRVGEADPMTLGPADQVASGPHGLSLTNVRVGLGIQQKGSGGVDSWFDFGGVVLARDLNTLTGTVQLPNYTGDYRDVLVRVQLRHNQTVVRTDRKALDPNGQFTLDNVTPGTYDIAVKTYTYLQKALTNVTLVSGANDLGTIPLINGDVDGDNEVTSGDLSVVLAGLGTGEDPTVDPTTTQARQKICLNGVWDFAAAGTNPAIVPTTWGSTIRVPCSWIYYGPQNFTISSADAASPNAWFKRSFYVPASWADGRRIKLRFLALDWAHAIYVNGAPIYTAGSMDFCLAVDITSQVVFGQYNTLAVSVQKRPDDSGFGTDMEAGIIRSVYLESVPAVHVEYSHVITSVRNMTITVKTLVKNEDTVSHNVIIRPVVKNNGAVALTLPASASTPVPAGGSVEIPTSSAWSNPVLWGFGQYGQPYLYHLETNLDLDNESSADISWDRFGFREFWTSAQQIVFNGITYYIKGDLLSRAWPFVDNPSFVTAFYQAERSANCSFQRMHSSSINNFDSSYWYEVGDELGHLVEPEMCGTQLAADDPANLALWTSYVNYYYNDPSIVMWCPDNEYFSRWTYQQSLDNVTQTTAPPWNNLATHIRSLDSTRIVDFNCGWMLYKAVRNGWFNRANFMTFNVHPYGTLSTEIQTMKNLSYFDNSVPTLVGEIYDMPNQQDIIGVPISAYNEELARGNWFYNGMVDVFNHGAGGSIWCALQAAGFTGCPSSSEVYLGPWTDYVVTRDGQNNPIGDLACSVNVKWPSLSGEGTKAEFIDTSYASTPLADGGYGHNINWFDPTRPMFNTNIAYTRAKAAYTDKGYVPPALGQRANEVVVCFGIDGVPYEGAYVYLSPTSGQAWIPAVATDSDGTAWFRVWDTGTYNVVVLCNQSLFTSTVTLASRPTLSATPGYSYITWVDMGGINIAQRQADLTAPPTFSSPTRRMVKFADRFEDGNLNKWTDGGATNWMLKTDQYYTMSPGTSVRHDNQTDDLISDNIDTTSSWAMTVSFRYRTHALHAGDVVLQLYNGTSYNTVFDFGAATPTDTWNYYYTTITDSQYLNKTNFRIKFEGTAGKGSSHVGEYLWIDDVVISTY